MVEKALAWGCGLFLALYLALCVVAFFAIHLWAVWLLVSIVILGLVWYWWPSRVARRKREAEETEAAQAKAAKAARETAMEAEAARAKAVTEIGLAAAEWSRHIMQIPTSTSSHLIGYRILRQIRVVRVDNCVSDDEADFLLRQEACWAGAWGIINMKVRPYTGGRFSAQGDAVVVEKA